MQPPEHREADRREENQEQSLPLHGILRRWHPFGPHQRQEGTTGSRSTRYLLTDRQGNEDTRYLQSGTSRS